MGFKHCTRCGELKPISEFPRNRQAKSGIRPRCKVCHSADARAWALANHERYKARLRAYHRAHGGKDGGPPRMRTGPAPLEVRREKKRDYAWRNREKFKEWNLRWAAKNKHVAAEGCRRRQVSKQQATPRWANRFFVQEAYALARLRTLALGEPWVVDHIVPIKSEIVCGLHNEFNLQVIPSRDNRAKSNRYWPHMP